MASFRAILVSALLAGIVAGVVLTGLQAVKIYPLIQAAELFEPGSHGFGGGVRLFYSLLSNVLLGVALALVLAAVFSLRGVSGWHAGVLWGLGGFAALNLAPALGLPPELPGLPAAPLLARQAWWAAAALCTGGGLALIFLTAGALRRAAGVLLIAAPQIYGAPHPGSLDSTVPASLAAEFAAASLAVNLVFWVVLGALAAAAMARQKPAAGGAP